MNRIRLIHWNAEEARDRAKRLQEMGYQVAHHVPRGPGFLREMRDRPPGAVVIDLSRAPSQGRDIALGIRGMKATRRVPLLFVEGDPEKVAGVRKVLPDAAYISWSAIRGALKRAIAHPPDDPVVPRSRLEGYAGRPLPKKLGIKPGSIVGLVAAPKGVRKTLGVLPEGAVVRDPARGRCDLLVWFVRTPVDLCRGIARMADRAGNAPIWIAWPKRVSDIATDLTQQDVREAGLAHGLVDYKICAIDATWSGLLFTLRAPRKRSAGKRRDRR